jgi:hypothetical protein
MIVTVSANDGLSKPGQTHGSCSLFTLDSVEVDVILECRVSYVPSQADARRCKLPLKSCTGHVEAAASHACRGRP